MCFSVNASIAAAVIGYTSAAAAALIGHPVYAAFVAAYSSVQIAEGVIWHSIDTYNAKLNQFGTSMLVGSLSCHALVTVVASILYVYYGSVRSLKTAATYQSLGVLFILAIVACVLMWQEKKKDATIEPICEKGDEASPWLCRLRWDFGINPYRLEVVIALLTFYIISSGSSAFYILGGLYASVYCMGILAMLAIRKQFNISMYEAYVIGRSTLWCFGAALGAPLGVLGLWYFSRKAKNKTKMYRAR